MHDLGETTTATRAVIEGRVVFHVFGLTCFTIHENIVDDGITVVTVVGEFNLEVTGGSTSVGIVGQGGGEVPGRHGSAADHQTDSFAADFAASADYDIRT